MQLTFWHNDEMKKSDVQVAKSVVTRSYHSSKHPVIVVKRQYTPLIFQETPVYANISPRNACILCFFPQNKEKIPFFCPPVRFHCRKVLNESSTCYTKCQIHACMISFVRKLRLKLGFDSRGFRFYLEHTNANIKNKTRSFDLINWNRFILISSCFLSSFPVFEGND